MTWIDAEKELPREIHLVAILKIRKTDGYIYSDDGNISNVPIVWGDEIRVEIDYMYSGRWSKSVPGIDRIIYWTELPEIPKEAHEKIKEMNNQLEKK